MSTVTILVAGKTTQNGAHAVAREVARRDVV